VYVSFSFLQVNIFLSKSIWKFQIYLKVKVFVWRRILMLLTLVAFDANNLFFNLYLK
jgi:hypothetical protein